MLGDLILLINQQPLAYFFADIHVRAVVYILHGGLALAFAVDAVGTGSGC